MTRLPEKGGEAADTPPPPHLDRQQQQQQQRQQQHQQQQGESEHKAPWLHLWEVWQRGSVTPMSPTETWYVVSARFLKSLQQEASRMKGSMTPDAVAQALSNLDRFVRFSNQRLEQQQLLQLPQELRIVNAHLLEQESARKGFATKRTRLTQGMEKQLGLAFHVCDAPTWKVFTAWVPHDIEIPRGVYRHSSRLHVEVQPLLLHTFKAIGSSTSCQDTRTEAGEAFVATRADTLDFAIHKLKQVVGVEPFDACLHVSFQVNISPGSPEVSAPPTNWTRVWEPAETTLEELDLSDGVGLVLLHRTACTCMRDASAEARRGGEHAWDDNAYTSNSTALVQKAPTTTAGGSNDDTGMSDGAAPRGAATASASAAFGAGAAPPMRNQSVVDVWFATGGLVGLVNLANTCFLNAAVQCLSAVLPFSRHFLSGAYKAEINEQNCMGTQGRLANAYAKTLKALWASGESAFAPRELKWAVGEVREEFLGFSQQDSQELLAFLLDGIHEDLNRVRKKPYYEDKIEGAAGASDSVTALRSWQRHREIHDSIVVDLFQGQYRSQLVCPECRRLSVTFDPFLNLSLPLPHSASLRFHIAGCFEASKGFSAELHAKLPLTQEKAKDLALRVLEAALKDDLPQAVLLDPEKEELQRQIRRSASIHSFQELRGENVFLICRRPGDMTPGSSSLASGLLPFAPGDELRCKNEKKVISVFVWFLPARIVQELEGVQRKVQSGQQDLPSEAQEPATASTAPAESDETDDVQSSTRGFGRSSSSDFRRTPAEAHAASEAPSASEHREAFGLQATAKKRRALGLPLSLAASDSFFVLVAPLVRHQAEPRVLGAWMPILRLEHPQQKSKISGVFTQAVEVINKTFGPANADPFLRKWKLQVVYPFAAEDAERSVLGQGVAFLRDKLGGQLRCIPNEEKPLTQHMRPVKGQFIALVYLDLSGFDHLSTVSLHGSSSLNSQPSMTGGIVSLGAVRQSHKIHLADCLQLFAEREVLDQDNMWYCGTCRKHVQAQKKLDLWRMPRVLILHLKRFHNTNRWSRSKISTRVCFPYKTGEYLDMSQFILPGGLTQLREEDPFFSPEYELIGVNVHSGELGGGHYYAYTKIRGQWYEFNDSCVTPVHEDKCHSADAYMLTYELRSSREDSKKRLANVQVPNKAAAASVFQQQQQQPSCSWAV
ncbi:hypothetical protein Esti_005225 [Eimeria stiedai]